jgi:hypothetical protein
VRQLTSTIIRRGALAASIVALGVSVFASGALAQTTGKRTVIDTFGAWDGTTAANPFGCNGATTTYGQVFTVPAHRHHFPKLALKWTDLTTGSFVMRAELYAWDGSKATGSAIYESPAQTFTSGTPGFYDETLKFKGKLTPGSQYVAFGSIDKDFEQCSTYQVGWALDLSDAYSGGEFVYQNNNGDESQWTSTAWSNFGTGWDAAFKAVFTK